MVATVTITRYENNRGTVTLVKGKTYSAEQVADMPVWYREYLK